MPDRCVFTLFRMWMAAILPTQTRTELRRLVHVAHDLNHAVDHCAVCEVLDHCDRILCRHDSTTHVIIGQNQHV